MDGTPATSPGPDPQFRYDAFISYRHVEPDRGWAKWLHSALETYRVPRELVAKGFPARLTRVFRDEEELPANADLSTQITTALNESRFLIVICSPRAVESRWVNAEVEHFRKLGRHDRILALLIEGDPRRSFPAALTAIRRSVTDAATGQTAEEIEEVEPLAADVRADRTDTKAHVLRGHARLRLMACILGCRFDDLRQREAERRAQRARLVGVGLGLLVVVLSGLTAFAFVQRGEAIQQRGEAVKQTGIARANAAEADRQKTEAQTNATIAKRQKAIAQAVNIFMNERLLGAFDPDKAQGREVTVGEVVERALAELDASPPAEREVELELRITLGELLQRLGRGHDAGVQLERALPLAEELFGPRSLEVARVCDSIGGHGLVAMVEIKTTLDPVALLERCISIRKELLGDNDPSTLRAMGDLAVMKARRLGLNGLGIDSVSGAMIILARGKGESLDDIRRVYAEAVARITIHWTHDRKDEAFAVVGELSAPFEKSPLLRNRLVAAMAGTSSRLAEEGATAAAECIALDAIRRGREARPGDSLDTALAMLALSRAHARALQHAAAEQSAAEALSMYRRLSKVDSQNIMVSLNELACTMSAQERDADALPLLREAFAMCKRLGLDDQQAGAGLMHNLAKAERALGQPEHYVDLMRQSRRIHARDYGDRHESVIQLDGAIALGLLDDGRLQEAVDVLQASISNARDGGQPLEIELAFQLHLLARALVALQAPPDRSDSYFKEALSIFSKGERLTSEYALSCQREYAVFMAQQGRFDEAISLAEKAVGRAEKRHKPGGPLVAKTKAALERVQELKAASEKQPR